MTSYKWTFDPFVTIPLAVSAFLYAAGVCAGTGTVFKRWQVASFVVGWLALFAALMTPLHAIGEHLFTAHMIQHEVLMALAAPLLVLSGPILAMGSALPGGFRRWLIPLSGVRWIAVTWNWFARPLNATILHGVAIWIWHAPSLFDAAVTNEAVHRLQHFSFFATALLFWWALFRGARHHLGVGAIHVAFTMVHTSILGALIALSPRLLYLVQTRDAPHFGLTPLEDQQLGGLIMWVPAGAIYAVAALALVGFWIKAQERRPSYAE